MTEYRGGCHCGAASYRYATRLEPNRWPIRACQCSFCRLHAAVTTSDPTGWLSFEAADSALLQRYRFGTGATEFLICRNCGVYLGATIRVDASGFGVLNLNTMRSPPHDLPAPTPMNYDGETVAKRSARRAAGWTPLLSGSL